MKKTILPALFLLLLNAFLLEAHVPKASELTFSYPSESLTRINDLPKPASQISKENFLRLNDEVTYLLGSSKLSGVDQTVMPAYISNAQKDFAWLSYLLTGKFSGDLGPVTLWTMQLFLPNTVLTNINETQFDIFTSCLSALVVEQAAARLKEERKKIANYPIKKGEKMWTPTSPGYRGLEFGSIKPWFLQSSGQFLADSPPEEQGFWKDQCQKIAAAQAELDPDKVKAVYFWAGLTEIGAGSWEKILTSYLKEKDAPLSTELYARSVFFSALTDANTASFHSKYTFWIMRPSQQDKQIFPMITIPNHPSYPSAHSTISGTAAVILNELFPQNSKKWNELAQEAGMSRIWGGIHYPIDHENGLKLGRKIGTFIVQKSKEQQNSEGIKDELH